jgi:hypothetical protein
MVYTKYIGGLKPRNVEGVGKTERDFVREIQIQQAK